MESRESSDPSDHIIPLDPGIAYRDGFRIMGTPMGMGGVTDARLRFLASMDEKAPRKKERVLMHPASAAALCKEAASDVLAMDFNKKIRLGRMEIELYPSGVGLGAAQLLLTYKGRRILYSGGIRAAVPLFSPPAEFPPCDVLLIDVPSCDPKPKAPSRVAKELATSIERIAASGLTLVVLGTRTAALDVVGVLSALPFPIHASRGLAEMVQRCKPFIGHTRIRRCDHGLPKEGILLVLLEGRLRSGFSSAVDKERVVYVGQGKACPSWASISFRLGESEDRAGLAAFAAQTGARHVILGQRCDDASLESMMSTGVEVHRIARSIQMPFPFL
jgi:hypothetical protein